MKKNQPATGPLALKDEAPEPNVSRDEYRTAMRKLEEARDEFRKEGERDALETAMREFRTTMKIAAQCLAAGRTFEEVVDQIILQAARIATERTYEAGKHHGFWEGIQ